LHVARQLSAGFCEELMFRGYLIERISERTGSALVGAFVSWGLFVAGHIWAWGLASFITVAPWTALITYAYLLRRRLAVTILAHAASDVFAFVIMPLALRWLGAPAVS
jgi:membrane protease YdiL (CAAX protease family)